jgi:hypothetical protein
VWLGHHSPPFRLAVYVHVLSDELPESPFESKGGNAVGTRPAEVGRDVAQEAPAKTAKMRAVSS